MEMDQIEEFDSTSSSSSCSSGTESLSNESSGEDEGESSCEAGESDVNDSQEDDSERGVAVGQKMSGVAGGVMSGQRTYQHHSQEAEGGRRRKRLRKRKATGLRKKLRTHIESVDEFNPEARSAQSAELERLRRLQLQQSLTANYEPGPPLALNPPTYSGYAQPQIPSINAPIQQMSMSPLQGAFVSPTPAQSGLQRTSLADTTVASGGATAKRGPGGGSRASSSSPEVLMVDLTHTAKMGEPQRREEDAIVIDSGSDSDNTNEQGHPPVVAGQSGAAAVGQVSGQYGSSEVATPTRSQLLNMKYGEICLSQDGRVLVNAGHASTEEDIFLAPQIAQAVKPHQVCQQTVMKLNITFQSQGEIVT